MHTFARLCVNLYAVLFTYFVLLIVNILSIYCVANGTMSLITDYLIKILHIPVERQVRQDEQDKSYRIQSTGNRKCKGGKFYDMTRRGEGKDTK